MAIAGGEEPGELANDFDVGFTPWVFQPHEVAQKALRRSITSQSPAGSKTPNPGGRLSTSANLATSMDDCLGGAALGRSSPRRPTRSRARANISSVARRMKTKSRIGSGVTP